MQHQDIKFTSNKAIDYFIPDVPAIKIIGWVDSIYGLTGIANLNRKWICILNNNNGRRIRIVFFEADAERYSREIRLYQILRITGGVIRETNSSGSMPRDDISNKEFQFLRTSTLEVLGVFNVTRGVEEGSQRRIAYNHVEMKDVGSAQGPIMITGWLKANFRGITRRRDTTDGYGILCTDVHQIGVHVSSFVPRPDLVQGIKINIRGRIDSRGSTFILNCTDMDNVLPVFGAPLMSEEVMDGAVEGPPLILEGEGIDPPVEANE